MHVYFSGIGGAGIGPLALIAHQAGHTVSGSDKQSSTYIDYLKKQGIESIHIGQTTDAIAAIHSQHPIDWFVYSSALIKENAHHPEIVFANENSIKSTKRDEFLAAFIEEHRLALIAIAGTHGKTTTTAMSIWLCAQLGMPISYSVGAKLPFGDMGGYNPSAAHFIYECDEYDRNFLQFKPKISIIPGIDYDHPDIYPTREDYEAAFRKYIQQSYLTFMWKSDAEKLHINESTSVVVLEDNDVRLDKLTIAGLVNRKNALLVAYAISKERNVPIDDCIEHLNHFPGVSRRFEVIAPGIISDYAHTPKKIEGAMQLAYEVAGENIVVVYEGLHNTRQHFIKDELRHLFTSAKKLYVVPSYLAREDPSLSLLTPQNIIELAGMQYKGRACVLDDELKDTILDEVSNGNLVLCFTAGGGGSLDEWLRKNFMQTT